MTMASAELPASERFIVVYRFMWDELGLDGVTLRVFARIYGFCKDGGSEFFESRSATAGFLGTTPRTVTRSINELVGRGLIEQTGVHASSSGNVTRSYRLTRPAHDGPSPPGKTSPHDDPSSPDSPSSQTALNPDGSSGAPVTTCHPKVNGEHRA